MLHLASGNRAVAVTPGCCTLYNRVTVQIYLNQTLIRRQYAAPRGLYRRPFLLSAPVVAVADAVICDRRLPRGTDLNMRRITSRPLIFSLDVSARRF